MNWVQLAYLTIQEIHERVIGGTVLQKQKHVFRIISRPHLPDSLGYPNPNYLAPIQLLSELTLVEFWLDTKEQLLLLTPSLWF